MGGKPIFIARLLKSGIFLVFVLILAGWFLGGFLGAFWRDYQIRREISALMQEKEKWEKNKLISLEKLKDIKSQDFVEKEARLKFGLAKEGEKLVIINMAPSATATAATAASAKFYAINPIKWWNYFFK